MDTILFANSSAIAACLPANGRVCQCASVPAVSINTHARAHVYILENCWHAGTLARWHTSDFLFPLHALPYASPKQYDY